MGKYKQWRNSGDEDKFITNLIRKGKVDKFTKPATLKTTYPKVFGEFNLNVIRNHLNILKRANGLYLDGESGDELEENEENRLETSVVEVKNDAVHYIAESIPVQGVDILHKNYPVLCGIYKDPDFQYERVVMTVVLPSGANNVSIELNDQGTVVSVKYTWPKAMYAMEDMFKKPLLEKTYDTYHPKILCLRNALETVRNRVDLAPESFININLPIKVQTASDSWSKSGIKREDGTQIIFTEFKGFMKSYNKTVKDETVTFDM